MIRVADHAGLSPWHVALAELAAGMASASVAVAGATTVALSSVTLTALP